MEQSIDQLDVMRTEALQKILLLIKEWGGDIDTSESIAIFFQQARVQMPEFANLLEGTMVSLLQPYSEFRVVNHNHFFSLQHDERDILKIADEYINIYSADLLLTQAEIKKLAVAGAEPDTIRATIDAWKCLLIVIRISIISFGNLEESIRGAVNILANVRHAITLGWQHEELSWMALECCDIIISIGAYENRVKKQ